MYYPRKTIAEINLQALRHNFNAIKSLLQPQTKFMAVIKANAYGHGAVAVAQELVKCGADMLGVTCVYEVIELRAAGIKIPILNIGATFADDAAAVFEYDFTPTIFSYDIAQKISAQAVVRGKKAKVHLKVETGMGRLGAACDDVVPLVKSILQLPNIEIEGLFTHFANADDPSVSDTLEQLRKFNEVLQKLQQAQIKIPLIHAANSAGALFYPQSHFDMVRVGFSLYGYPPSDDDRLKMPVKLEPVMSLKTYIAQVKNVAAGAAISYGSKFVAQKESQIITLPAGYADCLRRTPQPWREVLVAGKKVPLVGTICMDQAMADASAVKGLQVGDEVMIVGKQGDEEITAWQAARGFGGSAYELLTNVSSRVTRVYI